MASCLHKLVSLSSTEADYLALSDSAEQIKWLRAAAIEIRTNQDSTIVYQDNAWEIVWVNGLAAQNVSWRKHVDFNHKFVIKMTQ